MTIANPTYHYQAPLPRDLWLLDPEMIYLNHGSVGACPRPVFEKYQWWQRELERQGGNFFGALHSRLREARQKLAVYVHTDADNLVYITNVTVAVNVVARSLKLKPGDEILTTDQEYGAMNLTWDYLFTHRKYYAWTSSGTGEGVIYKKQPITLPVKSQESFVEEFWSGVNERTRVVFLSHITSPTALILPVKEICRRARAAGIISVIDGAHAVGQLPLDLEDLGADFYTSNCHKWLCSPKGSAFLYARPDVQHYIEPLTVSFGYSPDKPAEKRLVDYLEYIGIRDPSAFLTVPTAIDFLEQNNWDKVRLQCHTLARQARERITALTGLPPISPDSTDWYMQMVSVPLPPCNTARVSERLWKEYKIVIPITGWHGKPGIRISCQAYVTQRDIDILIEALEKILPEERKD